MTENLSKTDKFILAGLFCTALFVSFTSRLNPFGFNGLYADTSVYLTIARGITEGQVPYRDFFDNKGPLLYLVSAPGMFLGGFAGVWITGLVLMSVSAFFAYKTALFFGGKFSAFLGVVCSFLVFRMFYYETAGAEYAMPFIMISLFIFTKRYFTKIEPAVFELITLGFCFAAAVLVRVNMFSLWLGFCLAVIIELIIKREFLPLLKYIIWFLAGVIAVLVPSMLYLHLNGAFADFLIQNFSAGTSRGFSDFSISQTVRNFFAMMGKSYSFAPLIVAAVWIIKNFNGGFLFYYTGFVLAYSFTILFHAVIGPDHNHYNQFVLPFLVPAVTFFIQSIYGYFSTVKYRKAAILVLLCVIFSGEIVWGISVTFYRFTKTDVEKPEHIFVGKIIDQNTNEGDKIIALGRERHIYLYTKRRPASRFIYQLSGAEYYQNTIREFLADMEKRPSVIVIKSKDGPYDHLPRWYAPVYAMIAEEYSLLQKTENYFLFKKTEE